MQIVSRIVVLFLIIVVAIALGINLYLGGIALLQVQSMGLEADVASEMITSPDGHAHSRSVEGEMSNKSNASAIVSQNGESGTEVSVQVQLRASESGNIRAEAKHDGINNSQVNVTSDATGRGPAFASAAGPGEARASIANSFVGDVDLDAHASGGGVANASIEDGQQKLTEWAPLSLPDVHTEERVDVMPLPLPEEPVITSTGAGAGQPSNSRTATITGDIVNLRSGPGMGYEVVGITTRGETFDVTGKNNTGEWWQICCYAGQSAWISNYYAEMAGNLAAISVIDVPAPSQAPIQFWSVPTPLPPPPAPQPRETTSAEDESIPTYAFNVVEQARFREDKLPRLHIYVGDEYGSVPNYRVRVRKDGQELPVLSRTFGGPPQITWPFADSRQRVQNLKAEFQTVPAAGSWEVDLLDDTGQMVAPTVTFQMQSDELDQEMYIRFQKTGTPAPSDSELIAKTRVDHD